MHILAFLGLVLGLSGQPGAGGPPARTLDEMSTDRPDITDSTDVVSRGVWQIETGVSFESDREDVVSAHELALPLAMLRVGVGHRLELRLATDGLLSDTIAVTAGASTRLTGRADVEIGAKWRLFERPRAGFLFAVEPVLSLPTGSDGFTSGGYDPTLKLIADRTLPLDFSVSSSLVISSLTDLEHRFTQRAISVSVSHALPVGSMSGWSVFGELYRASALVEDGGSAWIADTGATLALGRRAQLDVSVGRGLNGAAPDWFIGAGFSFRGFLGR